MQEVGADVRNVGSESEEEDIELDLKLVLRLSANRKVKDGCSRYLAANAAPILPISKDLWTCVVSIGPPGYCQDLQCSNSDALLVNQALLKGRPELTGQDLDTRLGDCCPWFSWCSALSIR